MLEAIRSGQTVAADADGNLYGDAQLVEEVRARLSARAPEVATTSSSVARWIAVGLVLFGLLGLLVTDRPVTPDMGTATS